MRAVYQPLTESVRDLIDATIRTEVDEDTVAAVKAEIDAATARLRSRQCDGPFGVRYTTGGDRMAWGNPVIGIRNPIAPPLTIEQDADGRMFTDFYVGAAYEGPPGHVHGGVAALVLDHVLGEMAANAESPRFTGTITIALPAPDPSRASPRRGEDYPDRRDQDVRIGPPRRRGRRHRGGRGRLHPAEVGSRVAAMSERLRVIVATSASRTRSAPSSASSLPACSRTS